MDVIVVIRPSRPEDAVARSEAIRAAWGALRGSAFQAFLLQELTLQCVVLAGAALFIFCGVSLRSLLLLPPLAAALLYVLVYIAHTLLADTQAQTMNSERAAFVAELHAPLLAEPARCHVRIQQEKGPYQIAGPQRSVKVIGTVSVGGWRGGHAAGHLRGLAVLPEWQRRGIGRGLLTAATDFATNVPLDSLECVTSELQTAASSMLYGAGWQSRGSYHRKLCGAALTLLLTHYTLPLPYQPEPTSKLD